MLTRLEVQGFKNLLDLSAEFGPFTCIAGENGVGKSNVFDAIEFLSYLASDTMLEAAQRIRGTSGGRIGDPRDLFWDGYAQHERRMRFAAEMIVPVEVEDDLGLAARASTTFLRYELSLGFTEPEGPGSVGRLALLSEDLTHIKQGDAHEHLRFPHGVKTFRRAVVQGQRRGGAFLSTEERDGAHVINLHGDGGSYGKPQPRPAARTSRTVLSTITTRDYPTILAARREMQSWRRLALEPSALRAPDGFLDPRTLGADGRHLAGALYRIANQSDHTDPIRVYTSVAGRLSDLSGLRVEELHVELDQVREVLTLFLREQGGLRLPARALSEGTLRFLALCVLLEDPTVTGLLCMEEPENGIHPANLPAMVQLAQDLAVDPELEPGLDNPFRQVIVNTHSPGVVQLCKPEDRLLARPVRQITPDGRVRMGLSLLPYQGSWRGKGRGDAISDVDYMAYLTVQPGGQIPIPLVG